MQGIERRKSIFLSVLVAFLFSGSIWAQSSVRAEVVNELSNRRTNAYYVSNKAPLEPQYFIKLPVTAIKPGGWLRKQLELQRDGLTGNLGEISIWLSKTDNAWLNKEGKGKWGWEELPYWLKGYGNIAYMLGDEKMLKETKFWIEAVLNNQRDNGDFGPLVEKGEGKRDLWTNMPMLWCLQSYYEYSKDPRVLSFMSKYFNGSYPYLTISSSKTTGKKAGAAIIWLVCTGCIIIPAKAGYWISLLK